uniref:Dienelactone hydrolase domain-containing protein n=1 Tax=uncultured Rhizobium sp. HF0500_35F13 TaxID=723627 RepID=E7C635_9HYPH|nr:hypothetical protein [uncultured Rhizobium sp. HF0500_35F13]
MHARGLPWLLLTLLLACPLPAGTPKRVSWLNSIQQPPDEIPGDKLRFLSVRQANLDQLIESRKDWEAHREIVRDRWLKYLGPVAQRERPLPAIQVLSTETLDDGIIRQRITYEVLPGEMIEAYLLIPSKVAGRVPGVVVLHSTVNHSIRQPAGVEGKAEKAFGLEAARRGMIAICPRNYLWPNNDEIKAQEQADKFLAAYPESKGMARMLHDSLVAVDLLLAQPHVHPGKIAAVGHSLGAKEVIYLAAFDQRVGVTISSEGGVSKTFSNWGAPWYLGEQIERFPHEHNELLGLIAPRPFLLIGGDSADGAVSWPIIADALQIYRLYDRHPPLGLFNHGQGHAVPPIAEQRIYEWLETYLD